MGWRGGFVTGRKVGNTGYENLENETKNIKGRFIGEGKFILTKKKWWQIAKKRRYYL